jgi:hypothetical protein
MDCASQLVDDNQVAQCPPVDRFIFYRVPNEKREQNPQRLFNKLESTTPIPAVLAQAGEHR